jgi:hypothetical protein
MPLRPPIRLRLPERKAVTIAAGWVCYKGIIIAADGEVTHGVIKSQRVKMFECSPAEDIKIMGAGAGDELLVDNVREKIGESLDVSVPDLVSIKRGIEKIVLDTLKDIWPLYAPDDRPDIELLLGVKAADGLGLFQVSGPLVREVPLFDAIGFGTDLAMYKAKYIAAPLLPPKIATGMLAHIIKVVKDNVKYCGGDSTMWILHDDGNKEEISLDVIRDAEKLYGLFELAVSAFAYLLPTFPGVKANQNLAEWMLEQDHLLSKSEADTRLDLCMGIIQEFNSEKAKKYWLERMAGTPDEPTTDPK